MSNLKRRLLARLLPLLFSVPLAAHAQAPSAPASPPPPGLANQLVEFRFDARHGTYSIIDKRDNSTAIRDAVFSVNHYASNEGYAYSWSERPMHDALGQGRILTVEGKVAGYPTLILEVAIYDGRSAVVLTMGTDNPTADPLRIMQFSPLKGDAFPGQRLDDYKTLDGENGATLNQVSGAASVSSRNNLLATFGARGARKHALVMGGLTYREFQKNAAINRTAQALTVELKGEDPVGKLVDPHSRLVLGDQFYIDIGTDNRYEALETYADSIRLANHIDVSGVNIPILNFWYAFVDKFGGDQFRDNSTGTIEEMQHIIDSGFLRYAPVGLRLEPDDYALPSNQQGWWDDEHWGKYKGGQLQAPYDTMVKWGSQVRAMGGVPFIYNQTAKRSEDYALAHPDHMLFNSATRLRSRGRIGWWGREGDATAGYWTYDFTDAGFIAHMRDVYANLRAAGVRGIKLDYPDTGWAYDGGFEDQHATTTSAYRNIFQLAYDGLGPGSDVQERIPPFGDVALGAVTTQRTEGDNDRVYPARISKTGLRWYKNRVVVNYDHDPINPFHVYPANTREGWRAAITMTTTTSGRLELGKYFEKMSPEMLHDLSRAVPLLDAPALSARPVDAFSGGPYPQVYDLRLAPSWHILTLYNHKIDGEEWPTESSSYWAKDHQFNPARMLPADIKVALAGQTDDGALGLDAHKSYYAFDFWNWRLAGKYRGGATLGQRLRPGEARVLALHEVAAVPQFLSTSRHLLQGWLDMPRRPEWDAKAGALAGTASVIAQEGYKIIVASNGYRAGACKAVGAGCKVAVFDRANGLLEVTLASDSNAEVAWSLVFAGR